MRLTCGMAHYEDYDGVAFTIQSLRLSEPELMDRVEFLVVDNNPNGPHGKAVKNFLGWVPNARYIAAPESVGTSAPRDRVFREATGDAVLCMDCHVLLKRGSLKRLLDYYEANPNTPDLLSGPMWYDDMKQVSTHFKDEWRGEMWGTWDTDPRGLDVEHPPFEIGAMGLGLFSCRKDAWQGFNPAFRGFGGEEWYIHEKFRKAGAKCLCLPWLRWWHRFGRPGGVPYPLTRWNKVRNYVIGHRELDRDLEPIHTHFVKSGLLSHDHWEQILSGAVEPKAAEKACGGCGQVPATLEEWYAQVWKTPSDINEHVPTLRRLAEGCEHVVEFGHRRNVSSVAILAGQPKRFTSYDLATSATESGIKERMGATEFRFIRGDSLEVDIEECDLLFIDTRHTATQLLAELTRHGPKCRRRIALHDTTVYGTNGEGGGPGLLPALREWLRDHPEWSVVEEYENNNGMMVLSRDPSDKPTLPSSGRMAVNYALALTRIGLAKLRGETVVADEATVGARLDVCALCKYRTDERCSKCGCYLVEFPDGKHGKAMLATEDCPQGKWAAAEAAIAREGAA